MRAARVSPGRSAPMKKLIALILVLILPFSGCVSGRGDNGASVTHSAEMELGEKIHSQILSDFHVYTEPRVLEYLNAIAGALGAQSKRDDLTYRVTLLYHEKIYATSAPGGFLYLTTGMVNFVHNEAELAAVLAHEIGEVQFIDPRLSKTRQAFDKLVQGGAMITPFFGQIGALAALGLVLVHSGVSRMEPDEEKKLLKSDAHAMEYMVDAGYDPQGMIDLQQRFLEAPKEQVQYFYDYYQTRPISEKRISEIHRTFEKLPLQDRALSVHYERFQEMTQGVREMYQPARA